MKPIRKAVRTFLIKNNKVLVIKYTSINIGFYDIPGGKIEENETSIEASLREFKEETTIKIKNQKYSGNLIVEYPDRIYDLDIYITNEYLNEPINTTDYIVKWIDINELLNENKLFPVIHLLEEKYNNEFYNSSNFKLHFIVDNNHKIL